MTAVPDRAGQADALTRHMVDTMTPDVLRAIADHTSVVDAAWDLMAQRLDQPRPSDATKCLVLHNLRRHLSPSPEDLHALLRLASVPEDIDRESLLEAVDHPSMPLARAERSTDRLRALTAACVALGDLTNARNAQSWWRVDAVRAFLAVAMLPDPTFDLLRDEASKVGA